MKGEFQITQKIKAPEYNSDIKSKKILGLNNRHAKPEKTTEKKNGHFKSVYLASRYARREELNNYAGKLENLGYNITSKWLTGHHILLDTLPLEERHAKSARFAQEDLDGIKLCDLFILFTDEPVKVWKAGGMFVELGFAMAQDKKILIVGERENVFCFLPKIKVFKCWVDCLTYLF